MRAHLERVLLVEHKVEAHPEGPHVHLKPVRLVGVEFGTHVVASAENSFANIGSLAEAKVCDFVSLILFLVNTY